MADHHREQQRAAEKRVHGASQSTSPDTDGVLPPILTHGRGAASIERT
jgi:hypothetical protein